MERGCFTLQVKPDLIDEYVERHKAVSPDMLAAIRDSGRRNFSIFLRAYQGAEHLPEVFNLEAQLAALGEH